VALSPPVRGLGERGKLSEWGAGQSPGCSTIFLYFFEISRQLGWWRGSVVERRSLAGELSLSCARPAADG